MTTAMVKPPLRAPFPWFGGKSRVADVVWARFGDVPNYVEPFAGSLAVLLARPHEPRTETVNDLDCYVANFWRAVAADPDAVAHHADWPVNEADLHARHKWLVTRDEFRQRMKSDPDHFDAKIAGWWAWGVCAWIGQGWCRVGMDKPPSEQLPHLQSAGSGLHRKLPHLGDAGSGLRRKLPHLGDAGSGLRRKLPHLGDAGRGLHRKLPHLGNAGMGLHRPHLPDAGLGEWISALAARLRRVRVACGDWTRVMSEAVTITHGITAVFLDPPYDAEEHSIEYAVGKSRVARDVREWALQNGDNPLLRIALCGYEGEHDMPDSWSVHAWKAKGGYGSQGNGRGRKNAERERIWFSPACINPNSGQMTLADVLASPTMTPSPPETTR